MRRAIHFIVIVITSILIASLYGVIHDQITYTISNEYYTLYKFPQFGINEWGISNTRSKVSVIGILATWWVVLYLGLIYGIISLFLKKRNSLKITLKSILMNILTAIIFGIFGFLYGWIVNPGSNNVEFLSEEHLKHFWIVGCIHNFSYFGGLMGLFIGIYFQIKYSKPKRPVLI